MATAATPNLKKLVAITECSICLGILKNPKSLPCLHTFCLECLKTYGKDKVSGGQMDCPLCRHQFTVPLGGFQKLPSNFFIDQVLEGLRGSVSDGQAGGQCELCSTGAGTKFCVECYQVMCDSCSTSHLNARATKQHKIITQGEKNSNPALAHPSYCEKHIQASSLNSIAINCRCLFAINVQLLTIGLIIIIIRRTRDT